MKPLTDHCTDEQLLAFLDGELGLEETTGTQRHLSRCWHCRAQMQEIESRAQQLALLMIDPDFLGADRIQAAKDRFLFAARAAALPHEEAAGYRAIRKFRLGKLFSPFPPIPVSTWAAAAVASLGLLFVAWISLPLSSPGPSQTISAAVQAEAAVVRQPLHQEIAVSLVQSKPKREQQNGHLEIWSDATSGRYTAKWRPQAGGIAYAVWQPDSHRRFRYDEQLHRPVAVAVASPEHRAITAIISGPSDFEAVRKRFETWVGTREWQPVKMAQDFSLLVNAEGVLLRTETKTFGTQSVLIVSATSKLPGQKITVSLELDSISKRVRAQEIRFDSPGNSVALRLAVQRTERMQVTPQLARLFTPEFAISSGVPVVQYPAEPAVSKVRHDMPIVPSLSELADMQIKLEFELHRVHACVDDSISVLSNRGGIRISGVVDNSLRKSIILEAIGHLVLRPWVQTSIQTIDEVSIAGISPGPLHSAATPAPVNLTSLPSTPSGSSGSVAVEKLPLDTFLANYFAVHALPGAMQQGNKVSIAATAGETAKTRTADYSSALVALSQRSHREAWAIRRLAEHFSSTEAISRESLLLLETMVRDHAHELHEVTGQMTDVLQPVFAPKQDVEPLQPESTAHSPQQDPIAWPTGALALFQQAAVLNTTLFDLFASGNAAVSRLESGPNPESAMTALVTRQLPELKRLVREAETLDLDRATMQQALGKKDK